jgi:hypothetical protein
VKSATLCEQPDIVTIDNKRKTILLLVMNLYSNLIENYYNMSEVRGIL